MEPTEAAAHAFIAKWKGVAASELSTSQSFLIDLCELLGVARPHPTPEQDYLFERPITFRHGDGSTSPGRIDLYRRGAFVLESKKLKAGANTKGFDEALLRARSQAEAYARSLPAEEGRPPFVIVVDVGQRIELYSEFSRSGATYTPFPDPRSHRIAIDDLAREGVRARLRAIWLDPLSLDPARESARVTREIATRLAELAKSLERAGHAPELVAQFLMRCLFTMFAEDVRLLPEDAFRNLLQAHRERPGTAMRMVAQLWQDMDGGGFSAVLAGDVLRFNGKLFKNPTTLPLDRDQIDLLIAAARADWKHVEPAIFGTLLERALSPDERHKLGAHYTPRAYVERLVLPTVIEPLRGEWSDAQVAAATLAGEGRTDDAVAELLRFHGRLCSVRVLDPACGSGNFLYVTLEHLKRLEGEVLNALDELGHRQTGLALAGERADAIAGETVDPHNLLGIELNPRAAAIAEVVLWIGYLQWHFRTRGDVNPPIPVIRDFRNIENRDAALAYDRVEPVLDVDGRPVMRWDGRTMKKSPVTGEDIPDEAAQVALERYVNPRKAVWPAADFVVGNPPFIGNKRMRTALGDGYVEALRSAWTDVPESADFVMYWWHHAAQLTRRGALERFGFITTNSIRQAFNRKVVEAAMAPASHGKQGHVAGSYEPPRGDAVAIDFTKAQRPHRRSAVPLAFAAKEAPVALVFAIPDHPWVDTADGAAVRIAMTSVQAGNVGGVLREVDDEREGDFGESLIRMRERRGRIYSDLKIGADVAGASKLAANVGVSSRGMIPFGEGMLVTPEEARSLGLGRDGRIDARIRPYRNGRDLSQVPRGILVIDMFGLSLDEVMRSFPEIYQRLLVRVKPARANDKRKAYRDAWWIFAEPRSSLRAALKGLHQYIATVQTSKHRFFTLLDSHVLPDDKLIAIASGDRSLLGVLSSVAHSTWAISAGARMGVGNDPVYNKSTCFECFAFPSLREDDAVRIGELAESLDSHRKQQQAAHPDLTLTGMYNVLEKLRSGEALTPKERAIHEQGLVSVLRQIHDELDAAVLDAYGWSDLAPLLRVAHGNDAPAAGQTREEAKRAFDEAVLERLVALNAERAAEEARGIVRWLRPEFQNPAAKPDSPMPAQDDLVAADDDDGQDAAAAVAKLAKAAPWPKDPVAQVRAVADVLGASAVPLSTDDIASRFTARGPWKKRLPQLLEMLEAMGRARRTADTWSSGA